MKPLFLKSPFFLAIAMVTAFAPALQAAPEPSLWRPDQAPVLPLRYIEPVTILQFDPQIANAETYASESLYLALYPSIQQNPEAEIEGEANSQAIIASKTRDFEAFIPRGNLSPSYVQEFAYIDAYSNIRKYDGLTGFPNIQIRMALPQFGNGFGGGYQPLQFAFWPVGFGVW